MSDMSRGEWGIAELLPHAGPAVLLHDVVAYTDNGLLAGVTIHSGSAFHQAKGVPAHVGIEYMAQACGAFSGLRALCAGTAPRMGFLLGTRRYQATRAWFADGAQLVVAVDLVYRDDDMGMFDCCIRSGDEVVAKAQLIVAETNDVSGLLGRQGGTDDG
jgi:predicted hotdog family 3-hydroxylacyl-ACP dehydratase